MNIIFYTQSNGFNLFWEFARKLSNYKELKLNNIGFFLTNKKNFIKSNLKMNNEYNIIKEWEILEELRKKKDVIDINEINQYENKYGNYSLWDVIISDRRALYPNNAQFFQNYKNRYSHEQLIKLLIISFKKIEKQFDELKPDLILGLNFVTIYDYIYYLIAKKKNIPCLQLKLTRIENFVTFFLDPFNIPKNIRDNYNDYLKKDHDSLSNNKLISYSQNFLKITREKNLIYEGAISKKNKFKFKILKKILNFNSWYIYFKHFLVNDKNYSGLYTFFLNKVIKRNINLFFTKKFLISKNKFKYDKLEKIKYALFPLNTEPEAALLVYGKQFRNQIETIRYLASCLPINYKLIVKEHPNSKGYRKTGYYKKLQQIPNVLIFDSNYDSEKLIKHSDLVFVIYGTIGLETIINKKPLICFSKTPYSIFPKNMVSYCENLNYLPQEISNLLKNYKYDEKYLLAYIYSYVSAGVRVNLFTQLLKKDGRHDLNNKMNIEEQYDALCSNLIHQLEYINKNKI